MPEQHHSQKITIAFIERKYWRRDFLAFSIEKIFEQIARLLPEDRFASRLVKAPYGNSFFDVVRNLILFRSPPGDIYHITGQIHYLAMVLPPDRTVLTIHDLAFLQGKRGGLKRAIAKKLFLDLPVKRSKYITVVSNQTKNEIVQRTGCDPDKIRVIENPVQEHYLSGESKNFNKVRPLILQVGITANKNIPRLVEAVKDIPCKLKVVGNSTPELVGLLDNSGLEYEIVTGLDDDEMREAYRTADIVSFCSTYEGFGLPIIEAQAMRTPVVTSDLSPMKDVADVGACLVDPYDVSSIRAGITKVIEDDGYREAIVRRGRDNVQRFDPNTIASRYAALYEEIHSSLSKR